MNMPQPLDTPTTTDQTVVTVPADPVVDAPAVEQFVQNAVDNGPANAPQGKVFTAEEVEAIRRQEKDKVYGRIEALSDQLATFQKDKEEQARIAAEEQARLDAERKKREDEELDAKSLILKKEDEWKQTLNTAQQEWEQKFQAMAQEAEAAKELLRREQEFQALESYKNRRLAEEQENIMPVLLDYVTGSTQEEIESSISSAIAKTSATIADMQAVQQPRLKPVPTTGQAPSGPSENLMEQKTYTLADVSQMDMSTYAANREKLLAAVSPKRG